MPRPRFGCGCAASAALKFALATLYSAAQSARFVFVFSYFISFQSFNLKIEFRKGVRGREAAEQPLVNRAKAVMSAPNDSSSSFHYRWQTKSVKTNISALARP
jgi:hypothetical protein